MAGEILEQLSDDLRTNETFAGMNTASDIAQALLDLKGKVSEFEGKVESYEGTIKNLKENSITRLTETSTPEEKEAYYSALGRPKTKDDYQFQPAEGVTHSDEMVAFARDLFHKAYLNQEQAGIITQGWDAFVAEVEKAQASERAEVLKKAEETIKAELGDKYNESVELAHRVAKKHMGEEFDSFFETKLEDGTQIGNMPSLIKMVLKFAQLTGEDKTPPGVPQTGKTEVVAGMTYDKSPQPPKPI